MRIRCPSKTSSAILRLIPAGRPFEVWSLYCLPIAPWFDQLWRIDSYNRLAWSDMTARLFQMASKYKSIVRENGWRYRTINPNTPQPFMKSVYRQKLVLKSKSILMVSCICTRHCCSRFVLCIKIKISSRISDSMTFRVPTVILRGEQVLPVWQWGYSMDILDPSKTWFVPGWPYPYATSYALSWLENNQEIWIRD